MLIIAMSQIAVAGMNNLTMKWNIHELRLLQRQGSGL